MDEILDEDVLLGRNGGNEENGNVEERVPDQLDEDVLLGEMLPVQLENNGEAGGAANEEPANNVEERNDLAPPVVLGAALANGEGGQPPVAVGVNRNENAERAGRGLEDEEDDDDGFQVIRDDFAPEGVNPVLMEYISKAVRKQTKQLKLTVNSLVLANKQLSDRVLYLETRNFIQDHMQLPTQTPHVKPFGGNMSLLKRCLEDATIHHNQMAQMQQVIGMAQAMGVPIFGAGAVGVPGAMGASLAMGAPAAMVAPAPVQATGAVDLNAVLALLAANGAGLAEQRTPVQAEIRQAEDESDDDDIDEDEDEEEEEKEEQLNEAVEIEETGEPEAKRPREENTDE